MNAHSAQLSQTRISANSRRIHLPIGPELAEDRSDLRFESQREHAVSLVQDGVPATCHAAAPAAADFLVVALVLLLAYVTRVDDMPPFMRMSSRMRPGVPTTTSLLRTAGRARDLSGISAIAPTNSRARA